MNEWVGFNVYYSKAYDFETVLNTYTAGDNNLVYNKKFKKTTKHFNTVSSTARNTTKYKHTSMHI